MAMIKMMIMWTKVLLLLSVGTRGSVAFSSMPHSTWVDTVQQPIHATASTTTTEYHEFWGKPRSETEIQTFIHACLDGLDHRRPWDFPARVEVVSAEPPLVIIHNFLSPTLCQDIIDTAIDSEGLARSTTGESMTKSQSRTSSTVWLRDEDCPSALRLMTDKVSAVSGFPPSHMENLQVCRYLPGQEFKLHTDHQDSFNNLECRGRLATSLLYLSEPEAGGETWFPGLATDETEVSEPRIVPTTGSAVFFWNTLERPGAPGYDPEGFLNVDLQLRHAGLPVLAGEKFIANRWIHPIDIGSGVRGTKAPARAIV